MQRSVRSWVFAAAAIGALAWTGAASAEEIEKRPWDQQVVVGIAKQLSDSLVGVEDAFRKEPGEMMATGDRRSRYAAKQDLRRLRREARHLARSLEAGEGLEETLNVFLKVQEFARDAAENGKRAALTQPTLEKVATARAHMTELAPYYGETWTPVMNTR